MSASDQLSNRFAQSNALFERASRTIPLASQTFSKSHLQWVAGAAPLFLESAAGCHVTDVDGHRYLDYVLGLLPIILGYGDPDVDSAIRDQLDQGITLSLPHRLEMELSERLVRLIPCAEMTRFGKNGSDATTAAVRLARAHTGRDRIAVAGYHGWHDWYIGTTSRHLGVPQAVRDLSVSFPFNDADALVPLLQQGDLAAVVLEPAGATAPAPGFLQRLRELCDHHGAVLVFDEIITGFRIGLGGAQAHYGVTPDLAAFGKAMGNGMPISAIVGRADIMALMEDVFVSGTFGGELLSLAAAIATIDKLERQQIPQRLWHHGDRLRNAANGLAEKRGLSDVITFKGDGWWPRLHLANGPVESATLVSLLRQECTAHGLLLASSFNLCLAHTATDAIFDETVQALDRIYAEVRDALESSDPAGRLRGRPVQPVFSVR